MNCMTAKTYPKILIFGQSFDDQSGGGITLSNLFAGWPKESIAVMTYATQLVNCSTEICDTYYQLGSEEYKWHFPFKFFMPSYQSGIKKINVAKRNINKKTSFLRLILVNKLFGPFVRWTGLYFCASRISMSDKLKSWLLAYQPEALYIQVSTREGILFADTLCSYLKVPSSIHMMDDWPSVISSKGLFRNFWKTKIDNEFRQLLNKMDLHLCICDAMAEEYKVRYGLNFIPFHNPVETQIWLNKTKSNFEINYDNISILYAGRIGTGIKKSIIEIATALDEMVKEGYNIKLNIQTSNIEEDFRKELVKFKCIKINPVITYDKVPEVLSSSDILVFANDFNRKGLAFLKYSMPTKASEYMISGTPIFVYAPKESAASKLFFENDCGFCVFKQSKDAIIKGIAYLIQDLNYRKKISSNAVHLAKEKFDAKVVRMKFHHELINLTTSCSSLSIN